MHVHVQQCIHVQNTQLHNPMIPCSVAVSRLSPLLGLQSSSPSTTSRSCSGSRGETGTNSERASYLTDNNILCVRKATFRHHFRSPCFSQGPPFPHPNLLLSLGVAKNSFLTPPRPSRRPPPNSLIGSFRWATPTFSNREREGERERGLGCFGYSLWQSNK